MMGNDKKMLLKIIIIIIGDLKKGYVLNRVL